MKEMSLRDYFAAAALQGLMTSQNEEGEWRHDINEAVRLSYLAADRMLVERNETKPGAIEGDPTAETAGSTPIHQ